MLLGRHFISTFASGLCSFRERNNSLKLIFLISFCLESFNSKVLGTISSSVNIPQESLFRHGQEVAAENELKLTSSV